MRGYVPVRMEYRVCDAMLHIQIRRRAHFSLESLFGARPTPPS
jgi:hypothetical protein